MTKMHKITDPERQRQTWRTADGFGHNSDAFVIKAG